MKWLFSFKNERKNVIPIEGAKLLLFIGSPRTGSTLLGQILNYHPACLISNEFRLLHKLIIDKIPYHEALGKMSKVALWQFATGLENDPYYGKTLSQYQKQWLPFHELALDRDFYKREIKVIGDKKAGGNTDVYLNYPYQTINFLKTSDTIHLLQIIRNPVDAALSFMKSHHIASFEKACEDIIKRTHIAYTLCQKVSNPSWYIYYEDLLANPQEVLHTIMNWLNLSYSQRWLTTISRKINAQHPTNHQQEYIDIAKRLIKQYSAYEEFEKYKAITEK